MKKLLKLIKNKTGLSTFTPLWFVLVALAIVIVILLVFMNI